MLNILKTGPFDISMCTVARTIESTMNINQQWNVVNKIYEENHTNFNANFDVNAIALVLQNTYGII